MTSGALQLRRREPYRGPVFAEHLQILFALANTFVHDTARGARWCAPAKAIYRAAEGPVRYGEWLALATHVAEHSSGITRRAPQARGSCLASAHPGAVDTACGRPEVTSLAIALVPTRSPEIGLTRHDVAALLAICAVAVTVRACVMLLLPSTAYPDETFQYLEQANRLIGGAGLVPWEYQVGARSWLLPGLIAAFMTLGKLFGPAPAASLAAVSVLLCVMSLGPVICGFLWGRRGAGLPGAVTAGLLNAVWFELVYFSIHVLAETFATPALVVGLYLVYPGCGVRLPRRLFAGAALMGLAVVIRPQLAPAVGIAAFAICGGHIRTHWPAILAGLALPVLLSGLLDWVTWGYPFQSLALSLYYNSILGVASYFSVSPLLAYFGWQWVYWGPFGITIAFCALYGGRRLPMLLLVAAAIFLVHSAIGHKEYRFISPALPLVMTLAGIGSVLAADWLATKVSGPAIRRALVIAVPATWTVASVALAASPERAWFWLRDRGSVLAMRVIDADPKACGVAVLPASVWDRTAGYVHLRNGIALYNADNLAGSDAFNYVISYQLHIPAPDPPVDLSRFGFRQVQCWENPQDRHAQLERICLWRRDGACAASTAQPLVATTAPGFPGAPFSR